jgi:hypothetical protein
MLTPSGYTSVYEIVERVFDTFDNEDINFGTLVRHIADALLLIGSYKYMEGIVEKIDIVNHRGELPCNIVYINQTRVKTGSSYAPLRYATESFHSKWHDNSSPDLTCSSNLTYSLNGDMIYTSFEEGIVEMDYRGMPVDKNGYPLIPEDIKFKEAVTYHVLWKIAEKLFVINKITGDKLQYFEQQRAWYMGAAQSRANMLSYDQMESLANQMTRLIEEPLAHSKFYKGTGVAEQFKIQP